MRRPLPLPWLVVIGAVACGDEDTDMDTVPHGGPARITTLYGDATFFDHTLLSACEPDDRLMSASMTVGGAVDLRNNVDRP